MTPRAFPSWGRLPACLFSRKSEPDGRLATCPTEMTLPPILKGGQSRRYEKDRHCGFGFGQGLGFASGRQESKARESAVTDQIANTQATVVAGRHGGPRGSMTFGFQRRSVLPLPAKVNGGNPAPPASGVGGITDTCPCRKDK